MKTKQSGLVAVTVLTVSLIGSLLHGVGSNLASLTGGGDDLAKGKSSAPIPEIPSRDKEVVDKLGTLVGQLRTPRVATRPEIDYRLLGFSGSSVADYEATAAASTENFSQRVISLAYVSGKNRFAVVDGKLYREGDRLGEGEEGEARVRTITPTKVLLAGKEVRQWIEVENAATTPAATPAAATAPVPAAKPATTAAIAPAPAPAAPAVERSTAADAAAAFKGYADILNTIRDLETGKR